MLSDEMKFTLTAPSRLFRATMMSPKPDTIITPSSTSTASRLGLLSLPPELLFEVATIANDAYLDVLWSETEPLPEQKPTAALRLVCKAFHAVVTPLHQRDLLCLEMKDNASVQPRTFVDEIPASYAALLLRFLIHIASDGDGVFACRVLECCPNLTDVMVTFETDPLLSILRSINSLRHLAVLSIAFRFDLTPLTSDAVHELATLPSTLRKLTPTQTLM